jgi:hypothetical protein
MPREHEQGRPEPEHQALADPAPAVGEGPGVLGLQRRAGNAATLQVLASSETVQRHRRKKRGGGAKQPIPKATPVVESESGESEGTESGQDEVVVETTPVESEGGEVEGGEVEGEDAPPAPSWVDQVAAELGADKALVTALAPLREEGWAADQVKALIGLAKADDGKRAAGVWLALAKVGAAFKDQPAVVAAFARVPAWGDGAIAQLAAEFDADAKGRSAADWAAAADGHAALKDQVAATTAFARAGWTKVGLGSFLAAAATAGASAPSLLGLAVQGTAAADLFAMMPTWSAGDLGTFVGASSAAGAAKVAALVHEAGVGAATSAMKATWGAAPLGAFTTAILGTAATTASIVSVMGTVGFPAASKAMASGSWKPADVGTFTGSALAAGASADQVKAQAATQGMPTTLQNTTTRGTGTDVVGAFNGAAAVAGVTDANLKLLHGVHTFGAGLRAMLAQVTNAEAAGFTAGFMVPGGTAANLAGLLNEGGIPAAVKAWLASFTAKEVGGIAQAFRKDGGTAAKLATFMAESGAAAACAGVKASAAWAPADVGQTASYMLRAGSPPTPKQIVSLLTAKPAKCTPAGMRSAADWGTNWASVVTNVTRWATGYVGAAAGAGSGILATDVYTVGTGGSAVTVRIRITDWIRHHVDERHTVAHGNMSVANLTRNGDYGNLTYYPATADAKKVVQALKGTAGLRTTAEDARKDWNAGGDGFAQGGANGNLVGVKRVADDLTRVDQCYPSGYPNQIAVKANDAVAVGKVLGLTPA